MPTNIFNMADTWNSAGTVFHAIKMNVANTAAAAGSKILELFNNGASQFAVDPSQGVTVGTPTGGAVGPGMVNAEGYFIDGVPIAASLAGSFVQKTGDTMTGALTLNGNPVAALQAAPKQYVDARVLKSGDTMTGALVLSADPTVALHAATKQYVDGLASGKAPAAAEYITSSADAALTGERVLTNTATVTWDFSTAGQAKANAAGGGGGITSITPPAITGGHLTGFIDATGNVIREIKVGATMMIDGTFTLNTTAGGGNVMAVGSPVSGQFARWTSAVEIEGRTATQVTADLDLFTATLKGVVPASGGGSSSFLRSDGIWVVPPGAGNVSNVGTPVNGEWAQWTTATTIQGVVSTATPFALKSGAPVAGQWAQWLDANTIQPISTASAPWVQKAGDTMTGDLTIAKAQPFLALDKTASGQTCAIYGSTNTLARWLVTLGDGTVEGGANAGSNLFVRRYNDAGAAIDEPLTIARNTGLATVIGDPTAPLGIATKQYVDGKVTSAPFVPRHGRLEYVSSTQLKFLPWGGDLIQINGVLYQIPHTGNGIAGLVNTGCFLNGVAGQNLAASTIYYVYAFNNAGTITADFSTTGHAASTASGNERQEIKSGDNTRSLIGMIQTDASALFNADLWLTRTWFNPPPYVKGVSGGSVGNTSASFVSLTPNISVILWNSDMIILWLATRGFHSAANVLSDVCIGRNGVQFGPFSSFYSVGAGSTSTFVFSLNSQVQSSGSEGTAFTYQGLVKTASGTFTTLAPNLMAQIVRGNVP